MKLFNRKKEITLKLSIDELVNLESLCICAMLETPAPEWADLYKKLTSAGIAFLEKQGSYDNI